MSRPSPVTLGTCRRVRMGIGQHAPLDIPENGAPLMVGRRRRHGLALLSGCEPRGLAVAGGLAGLDRILSSPVANDVDRIVVGGDWAAIPHGAPAGLGVAGAIVESPIEALPVGEGCALGPRGLHGLALLLRVSGRS